VVLIVCMIGGLAVGLGVDWVMRRSRDPGDERNPVPPGSSAGTVTERLRTVHGVRVPMPLSAPPCGDPGCTRPHDARWPRGMPHTGPSGPAGQSRAAGSCCCPGTCGCR
jgi:hypothetical protein